MSAKFSTALAESSAQAEHAWHESSTKVSGSAAPRADVQEAHLSDYLEILKRRKWIVICFFVLIVGAMAAASLFAIPQYQASSQLMLGGKPTPMNPLGESPQRIPEINLYYKTQVNLLSSRTLARKVIKAMDLQEVYKDLSKPHPFLSAAAMFFHIGSKDSQADPITIQTPENPSVQVGYKVIDWYIRHLTVEQIRDSSLVKVGFTGPDASLITQIVNTHAQAAIDSAVEQHRKQAIDALEWLKTQISEQKNEVESSQRAIYEFKKQNDALSLEDNQIIFSQELEELNSALTRAKSDRIMKQATYMELQKTVNDKEDLLHLPVIAKDPVVQNLRTQLVALMSSQIELSTKYGPKHPKMIELNNGIEQLKKEIAGEANRQAKSIKADLDTAIAVENAINRSLLQQKQAAMSLGEQAIEYDVLKQQAESAQDIYDFLLKQSEELGLSSAISSSNMRIVDQAEVPVRPVSPKILLNLLLAVALSLFTGTGMAFFLEYLDNTAKTPLDVAVKLGLPVLGMIPVHKTLGQPRSNHRLIGVENQGPGSEILPPTYHISNRLPDSLRSPAEGLYGRVLIIESVTMGEGKTTVISQIASNLTESGLRVLLVDCDFQRPALDKLFKVSKNGGLGKSIDRIMSHNISSGSLSDYSVGDLFFLIALKKKTGRLIVKNEDQNLVAYFQNGVLVHIQNPDSAEFNRIGTMLRNGGFITDDQLDDALTRHRRTGQPMGYILINAGYIGRDKLRGPLRLQIEEYLQKMFSWKKGQFKFIPGMTQIYENEKIFFEEDYSAMINNLGRIEPSTFIEKELFENIHSLQQENLYLLPAGTSYKLIGALNQVLMKKVFEKLKHHFDVLLVDTPPLDAASGIESIFPLADGIVVVVKAGHLSIKVINGALSHLPQDKIIGTILNQVKMTPNAYYY